MNDRNRDKLIGELISIGGLVVSLWITKKVAANPDFMRTMRMKTALLVKRVADSQVSTWEKVSAEAATLYQKARI